MNIPKKQAFSIGVIGLIVLIAILGSAFIAKQFFVDSDNQPVISNKGESSLSLNGEEAKADSREKFTSKRGYSFLVPEGWAVSNADDWNKKTSLDESDIVGIVKSPFKETYPGNFHANIIIAIYQSDEDMFKDVDFSVETISGFMAHKDISLEDDDEELEDSDKEKKQEYNYNDVVLNGLNAKEYSSLSPTNKGNWFAEDNILIQVNEEKIYTFAFHDLGKRAVVDENLKVFKEFVKGVKIKQ